MTTVAPKLAQGSKQCIKDRREYNPKMWHNLGRLAVELGFKTPKAIKLTVQNPDEEQALHFLKAARPGWAEENRAPYVDQVTKILQNMKDSQIASQTAAFTTASNNLGGRDNRCGRPRNDDHEHDKPSLFLQVFYQEATRGEHISSLYRKIDMLHAFLGPYVSKVSTHPNESLKGKP
jgi:hypothetical protein